MKIGLVTEGPTDQVVIKHLLTTHFGEHPDAEPPIEFINLQPSADKTSLSSSDGGWELIYKWCKLNPPNERSNLYLGAGLFANDMDNLSCDLILVHMDSDVCDKISSKTKVSPVPKITDTPIIRGTYIRRVIIEWLWPDNHVQDNKHIVAPAVESVEAWLVAGLSDEDLDPENAREIEKRLAILDHVIVRGVVAPEGIKNAKKTIKNYEKISKLAAANIQRIIDRCPHFASMTSDVFLAISGEN